MLDFKEIEKEMADFWKKKGIYKEILARKGKKFRLLDGPPYANAVPHVGHIKNTVFKDLVLRRSFMQGFSSVFQPGFDTHGLPIENMVEKKLGLQSKKDIEKFGIGKFMEECKKNAAVNKDLWMKVYERLGSMYSLKAPYITYDNSYIEGGWWAFNEMHKKGMVYEGEKPVMWCPHCETSLAGYEVTDSYKDVQDPGIYVLFKLKNEERSLLVYTTTPWTLPANTAIVVSSKEEYVTVDISGRKIILAKKRLDKLSELGLGFNVIDSFLGKQLVGKKYEPIINAELQKELVKGKKGKAYEVVASIPILKERISSKVKAKKGGGDDLFEEFVTMNEGTGFVHTAPGHGKTDYVIGQEYGLACVSPVNEQCELLPESGFSGFVKKADKEIIAKLQEEGKIIHKETITHSYPLCWRCKSPLIFRLSKQLFIKVAKVKKIIQKENEKVNWLPEFAKERFSNWVDNAEDWNISRQRYWGIPIPMWKCECGKEKIVSSKAELEKLSKKKIDDLHLAESVTLKCECGKEKKKIKGIFDVWFDSGIAPWASLGYPEQNKKLFEENFPVDRINEAQDQIRGWFYSLMFCSVAVFGKAPYKAVSMVGWVVDKNGNKMSKSQGNVVSGEEAIDTLGADMLRYYICWDSAPYEIQKFNFDIAKKEIGKIFTILWNLQNLATSGKAELKDAEDKWIVSRLNSLIKEYYSDLDKFEIHDAARKLADFIVNDLSRRYIQMTREKEKGKIIGFCLEKVIRLLAPISPFISEKIWQTLIDKKIAKEKSVHLASCPEAEKKSIDSELEKEFENVLKIIELGLFERDKEKTGLKWPLAKAVVTSSEKISSELQEIIARQLNVKKIEMKKGKELSVRLDFNMTPELEAEGFAREFARKVQAERKNAGMTKEQIIRIKIFCDKEVKKMFESNIKFIKERVNAERIDFTEGKDIKSPILLTTKEKDILFSFS